MKTKNQTRILKTLPLWWYFFSNSSSIFRMVIAHLQGRSAISKKTMIRFVIGLAYVFLFFDLIPDFIPVIGWLDDIAVMTWVLSALRNDVLQFKQAEHAG